MLTCVKCNGHCHVIRLHDDSKMIMKYASLCVLKDKPIISSLLLMLLSCLWVTKHPPCLIIPYTCWLYWLSESHHEVEVLCCLWTVLWKSLLKISGLLYRLLLRSGCGCCTTPLPPWSCSTVLSNEPGRLKWTCLCCILNMEGLSVKYKLVGYTHEFRLVWFTSCLSQILFLPSCAALHVVLTSSLFIMQWIFLHPLPGVRAWFRTTLATLATARFNSKSLNYSVFNLVRALNLLRIWPEYLHREQWYSHHHTNWCVADIPATCSWVAAVCSCLLSVLPVSYKNRQCIVAIEPNQPEFISISSRFYVAGIPFIFSVYINEFTLIFLAITQDCATVSGW